MNSPLVGQRWSLIEHRGASNNSHRVVIDVTKIENGIVHGIIVGSGRTREFQLSAIQRGLRGARLEREADGHVPYRGPTGRAPKTAEETASASDYVRVFKPRGVAMASAKAREALALYESDVPVAVIAQKLDVSYGRARDLISAAREAIQDERSLRALERR